MVQIFRFFQLVLLLTLPITAQVIFNEGFEGSTSAWTVSGGGWEFGTPTAGPTTVPEGSRCAGTILNGQYVNNAAYYLTSPQITIPNTDIFILNFREYLSTESNYDYANLQIEKNGSNNWVNLNSTSTSNTTWQLREFDLSSYRNSTIRLRFYFDSDGSATYYGWYVDDIKISRYPSLNLTIQSQPNGTTIPSGSISVRGGYATSISALPFGGYFFQNWTVVRGNPVIANPNSASTTVSVSTDSSIIRANFQINPNTRPNVQISDVTISSHPDICITASVTDTAGRSIAGLDSSNFILKQDNDTVDFQITTISQMTGVSVTLVIDRSGSMSGTPVAEAKLAAKQFVSTMNPLDRCAIVSFESTSRIDQVITSDTTLLNAAIDGISGSGGTSILTGTAQGLGQLLQETNSRNLIVFSDGQDGTTTTLQAVIDSARNNNIRIYSIGIGSSASRTILGALADSTGGYFTAAPDAAALAGLYAQIKNDVQAQYILCYRSPDIIFNGDTHQVVLSAILNNHTDKDTVYWNENNNPPQITLTAQTNAMIGVSQTQNQPLTISADVTDDGSISLVRLFYRHSNITAGAYTEVVMANPSGTLYQYTLPANQVVSPGIDFYILATDNYHLIGRSPNILAPETQPWVIPINNDVPVITQTPITCLPQGVNTTLSAVITDHDGTFIAFLYYKKGNETFYTIDTMNETSATNYSAIIPGSMITADGIDYYFRAVDNVGASVRNPGTSFIHLGLCNANNPIANAGPDQTLSVGSSNCIISASLNGTGSIGNNLTYSWTGPFSGTLTGATPTANLPFGKNEIILSITSASSGLSDLDTVLITVRDTYAPVPNQSSLPDITGQCSVTISAPTATDNCGGIITAKTSSPTTFSTKGTFDVEWVYTDSSGNSARQTQKVIIEDLTAPVPDHPVLPIVRGECTATVTDTPTATDNCSGLIKGTTLDPLTYATQDTYTITWRFSDPAGNTTLQPQQVIVDDITPPIPEKNQLDTLYSSCSIVLTAPFAIDICSGRIQGTTTPLTINNQGTYTITWSYNDGNGNVSTQDQTIIVKDTLTPVFTIPVDKSVILKSILSSIPIQVDPAVAIDNCTPVSIQGVRGDGQPLGAGYSEGVTQITWTACDTNNNCSTVLQNVTVIRNKAPVVQIPSDTAINEGDFLKLSFAASDTDGTIPKLFIDSLTFPFVFEDSGNGSATLSLRPGCTDHGTYTIKVHASDNIDTTNKELTVTIKDINYPPEFDSTQYYKAHEMVQFSTLIRVYDCDNPNPKIRIINAPKGASFTDNNNGTGTFVWTPDADDNGFYMVIFEAQDDMTTVRDTIIIEITDVNAFTPDLTVSTVDTTIPLKLPVVIYASAKDRDGTPTYLQASGMPSEALFESDNTGNAVFRWTPKDTGTYHFSIVAIDGADTTSKVIKPITLKVSNVNVTGPKFLPINDFIVDQNQQLLITLEARDPDGTVPVIHLKNSYSTDFSFSDNGNGTATISWIPPCNLSGTFHFTATASDQSFTDSISIAVTVRDVNCRPVLFRTSDITAQTGEMVRIPIKAYDPDGDTIIPTLSVICMLPGHTFTTSGNGTALFRWQAIYESGSYPVTFYASDGMLTDSFTLYIHINKTGSVHLSCSPSGSAIYTMPSAYYSGEYIGTDSVLFSAAPGVYHFEIRKESYRSERFSLKIAADSTFERKCTLKPSIPLMTLSPDSMPIAIDSSTAYGPFAFADLNRDGFIDYSVLGQQGIRVFLGLDSTGLKFNSKIFDLVDSFPVSTIVHYEFVDWNNDKTLDCIYSDFSGNIVVANLKTGMSETILSFPGSKMYASVIDIDNDHKKDLAIHNEGAGLMIYLNQGTDKEPLFTEYHPLSMTDGHVPALLHGPFTFIDFDGNGTLELLIIYDRTAALFNIINNFRELTYIDDLNCAGKRLTSDSLKIGQIGSSFDLPHIIFKSPKKTLIYGTHLLGDVNKDKKVDIRDISKISKLWEITESDPLWDPQCNLKLSTSGQENIDIRDISKVGKCWELQQ
jgi:VWFA-related protein